MNKFKITNVETDHETGFLIEQARNRGVEIAA